MIAPALPLLRALAKLASPHVKVGGLVVSVASIRRAVVDLASGDRPRLVALKCPRVGGGQSHVPPVYSLIAVADDPGLLAAD
mmetsp:Transcript_14981/g.60142  ORF Transcript_14981/g.60142 Transcript_14981/m.60142 type:complete len:82 (-) Transcript_14981:394-639(-)